MVGYPRCYAALTILGTLLGSGCHRSTRPAGPPPKEVPVTTPKKPGCPDPPPRTWAAGDSRAEARQTKARARMVAKDLRNISDGRVLEAMGKVPRHRFVDPRYRSRAYGDHPLPHGCGQTISQPYIVALMTELLRVGRTGRVLDVGTGSGYQAAVLAELVPHVYSIEIICELADTARARLKGLGYSNVTVRCGDGYAGWKEHAPFDAIVVAAAPDAIPPPLIEQLAPGGRLVIPVGTGVQELIVIEKRPDGTTRRTEVAPVRFVPMTRKVR